MSELNWREKILNGATYHEAFIGDFSNNDGVRFSLVIQPTSNIRGIFKLLVEVADTNFKWETFYDATRYYHDLQHALGEAELIAQVLVKGRKKND